MDQILAVNFPRKNGTTGENSKRREEVETQILEANSAQKSERDLLEGDVLLDPTDPGDVELINLRESKSNSASLNVLTKRQASRNMKWLWHTKQIPYIISPTLANVKANILNAISTFNKKTCVQFVPKRKYERNYILFDKRQGCYSRIGKAYSRPGPQIISIGDYCENEGIIIHEMLHSVGFYHEQSRPDRQDNIEILWENIKPGFEDQFLKYGHGDIDNLQINYNYKSIMHYGREAFSKSPKLATMQVIGRSKAALGNVEMSPEDIIELDALYRCTSNTFNSWTSWSSFSPCDSSCYKNRQRFCYGKTVTSCGGTPNSYGVERQYVKCTTQECPAKINGHWGSWSSWGPCSTSCNEGMRKRVRSCDNPSPKNNGKQCSGSARQQKICVQPRCLLGKGDTDFRNRQFGIWQNDIYDTPGFDWIIGKGPTPSEPTGPNSDHTTTKDYYLYIESSRRASKDVARLISENLPKTKPEKKCLKFFYHMYGRTTGSLSVRLYPRGKSPTTLFVKNGQQGKKWKPAEITLDTDVPFQLVFEAMITRPSYSDIAIDDIFIDNGSCDCQDKFVICQSWAQKGQCKNAYDFMFTYCQRSCNFCDCRDSAKWNCSRWSIKECKKNPLWMETMCPVTCRVCGCYDKNIFCSFWKAHGQCEKNPKYMKIFCRKSCEICGK